MSSTDTRTVDPATPHHSENGGHEMSDFSWTTVLWLLPISVIVLIVFFAVCIAWFKGAKDSELHAKQAMFQTRELDEYHAKESEILARYKVLDKDKGRVQIPIARAMELIAKENQDKPGRAYVSTMDLHLEGAAFGAPGAAFAVPAPAQAESDDGIKVEPTTPEAKPAAGQKSDKKGH